MTMTYNRDFGEDFQKQILAVLLRCPTALARFRSACHHTYFSSETLRLVARTLLAHFDHYKQLPTKSTLLEEIRPNTDDAKYKSVRKTLKDLYERDVSDEDAVLDKIVEFGRTQATINAVLTGVDYIEQGKIDELPTLVNDALSVGQDLLDIGIDYVNDIPARTARYEEDADETADKVPTGIDHLDRVMDGGLGKGELGVVLALPKVGKSTFLINIGFGAIRSLDGYNVVHYSCEMDRQQVESRYDDRLAGSHVVTKKGKPKQFREVIEDRVKKFVSGNVVIQSYPTRTLTPSMMRSHLDLLASKGYRPDVIIVDYADIMRSERRRGEKRDEVAGIYEDLRQIAGDYQVALWTGSQAPQRVANDQHDGQQKELLDRTDFAESFEKSAVVDAGVSLNQSRDERAQGVARVFLFSLRRGEDRQVVYGKLNRKQCSFVSTSIESEINDDDYEDDDDDDESDVVSQSKKKQPTKEVAKTKKRSTKKKSSQKKTTKKKQSKKGA